ncbi:MAG: NAD(P)H-hydrate dehydratase [Bacteroidales bacterium]|nr:NAD(P)H-hydrate dehydratase [Bacteroidales bacterium]
MKLFTTDQIKDLDAKTINLEGITSSELMDRAALALYRRIIERIKPSEKILVMAGPGNNGGDALAISRLLTETGYQVQTICCHQHTLSPDASTQLIRLQNIPAAKITYLKDTEDLTAFDGSDHIIDGLFGSGLNRPLEGFYAEIVQWINRQDSHEISIDLPSGLFGEDNRKNIPENIVHADWVLGLQFPRLSFLLAENEEYIKCWELIDISIHPKAVKEMPTPYFFSRMDDISPLLKRRSRFSHKGTFGKGLLIAGSPGMMGAAVLSSRAALRSGIGLLSVRIPASGVSILQTTAPEALVQTYDSEGFCQSSDIPDLPSYSAIAIGPGIGTDKAQASSLENILQHQPKNLLLDADALNLLSESTHLLKLLPKSTILTPHPKEFDRLVGKPSFSGYERLEKALAFAREHQVYIVLKGAYTACITPEGHCAFNSTGNPGMATGGSGDILTGIIVSLLAQGYQAEEACKLAVFLHGLSGDLALNSQSQESLLAGDIAENLGKAFQHLRETSMCRTVRQRG